MSCKLIKLLFRCLFSFVSCSRFTNVTEISAGLAVSKKGKVVPLYSTHKPSLKYVGENWGHTRKRKHSSRVKRHAGYPILRLSMLEELIPSSNSSMKTVSSGKLAIDKWNTDSVEEFL